MKKICIFMCTLFLAVGISPITFSAEGDKKSYTSESKVEHETEETKSKKKKPRQPVDINTANAREIARNLVNIGPQKAQLIIDYREQNGAFTSVEQLLNIKGIGKKTLERNKDLIVIEE